MDPGLREHPTDEHPAEFVLGTGRVVARLITELVHVVKIGRESELLPETALRRVQRFLAEARMAAAGVGPVKGPKALERTALLQKDTAVVAKEENRKRAMQEWKFCAESIGQFSCDCSGIKEG
jgi:hypothetical protein